MIVDIDVEQIRALRKIHIMDEPKAAPQDVPELTKGVFAEARAKIFHANNLRDSVVNMSKDRSLTKAVKIALSEYETCFPITRTAVAKARYDALEEVEELIAMIEEDCSAPMVRSFDEAFSAACKHIEGEIRALKGKTDE